MKGIFTWILLWVSLLSLHAQDDSISVSYTDTSLIIHSANNRNDFHSLTAGDAVRLNPGVFLRTTTAGGMQLVSAQGLNPQHVQVLWNGIPVNSGMLGVSDLSLFTVGYRQEVVYSSNKTELATGGIAGVVDIKSQPFSNQGYSLQFRQSIGSFGQKATALSHSGSKNAHAWGITVNADMAENDFAYTDYTILPNAEKQQTHAAFRRFAISPHGQWKGRNGHRLTWLSETVFNERQIPPTLVSPMFKALQRDKTTRQQLKWQQFRGKTYYELNGNYIYNFWFYDDIILSRQEENREHLAYLRYAGYFEPSESWKLFYGVDGKYTRVSTPNYLNGVGELGVDIHAGVEWKTLSWVQAKVISKFSTRSHLPVYFPAMAELRFYPTKNKDFRIWLRGSADARYSTLNDRFWQPGGNPDLQAEQSRGGAGGMQSDITLGKFWKWHHSIEAFINRVSDMILWMPTNKFYWIPMNIGNVRAYGGVYEQQLSMDFHHHLLNAHFSYAYNKSGSIKPLSANDKSVGKQLPYFPLHSFKGSIHWKWKGVVLSADIQSYSERYVTRDEGQAIPAYSLVNISAGYQYNFKNFGLEGRFAVNNLADLYYEEVVYRPMPGRNYLFSLIINWNHAKQNATTD